MDYVNSTLARGVASKRHAGEDRAVTAIVSGRRHYRVVGVTLGLLCVLQAALNISLRYTLYSSDDKTSAPEASCKNRTENRDDLMKRKLLIFDRHFQQGWVYFQHSFYYISSIRKTWKESRADCLQRGADLVIINSKEEQDFTRKFHSLRWIGLTDRGTTGTWEWVDGTPMTTSYWGPGEPNRFEGKNEDCVEIKYHDEENSWNDIPCTDQNFWICEKTVCL